MSESERARALAQVPLGREGSPQDVVEAVAYLVTAPYVTGHILAVDGGRSA
jgi:pteridine reductase